MSWLQEVTRKSYSEIFNEAKSYDNTSDILKQLTDNTPVQHTVSYIPEDSVDICDSSQIGYYNNTPQAEILKTAINYCNDRRLFTAVNKPNSLYVSFQDKVHKNRLIIPFYSSDNKIVSYQSRLLTGEDYPKYLTKYGEKCLYGENNIDSNIPYVFVFEGPIDAMFVKNGVAIGGASVTEKQDAFLKRCLDCEIIYVYDNDKNNEEMENKIQKLIKQNKRLFVWPKELAKYKDINELCVNLELDEFPYRYIIENSYSGIEAQLKESLRKS